MVAISKTIIITSNNSILSTQRCGCRVLLSERARSLNPVNSPDLHFTEAALCVCVVCMPAYMYLCVYVCVCVSVCTSVCVCV